MAEATVPPTKTLTVAAALQPKQQFGIFIGGKPVNPPAGIKDNQYWFLVLERTTLDVAYSEAQTSGDTVPAALSKFDNDKYLLIVLSYGVRTLNLPQGPLFDFLISHGGSRELRRLAQIVNDLGCGWVVNVAYALVGILGESDLGFDQSEVGGDENPMLTLQLMPIEVDGVYSYTPVTLPN